MIYEIHQRKQKTSDLIKRTWLNLLQKYMKRQFLINSKNGPWKIDFQFTIFKNRYKLVLTIIASLLYTLVLSKRWQKFTITWFEQVPDMICWWMPIRMQYSKTCLKRTCSKADTCLKRTKDFAPKLQFTGQSLINLTCLKRTKILVLKVSALERFHCTLFVGPVLGRDFHDFSTFWVFRENVYPRNRNF